MRWYASLCALRVGWWTGALSAHCVLAGGSRGSLTEMLRNGFSKGGSSFSVRRPARGEEGDGNPSPPGSPRTAGKAGGLAALEPLSPVANLSRLSSGAVGRADSGSASGSLQASRMAAQAAAEAAAAEVAPQENFQVGGHRHRRHRHRAGPCRASKEGGAVFI